MPNPRQKKAKEKEKKLGYDPSSPKEVDDVLQAIGQKNESDGIKWTQHFVSLWNEREREKNQFRENRLKKNRMSKEHYKRILVNVINELIGDAGIPVRYKAKAVPTSRGIKIELKDKWGRRFHRAFKPCGTPKIDFNVSQQYVGMVWETAEDLNNKRMTKSGVYLP